MSDKWDFYFANVNDTLASLFVDLGIRDAAPDPKKPWLLWIWIYFRQPRHDGLSSSAEAPILEKIEDALAHTMKQTIGADLAGRITTAGRREFYFYGPSPDRFEHIAAKAMRKFPAYNSDSGTRHDPEWTQYLQVLYPPPVDYERMRNRPLVEMLKENGDALKEPRLVSHWVYFNSAQDRSKFVALALRAGFKVANESQSDDANEAQPFGVTVERTDHVDLDSISGVTMDLLRLVQEVGGDYDGWETYIVKGIGE